jgi:hypothetical protein
MGLEVKRHKGNGRYQLISTVSDERIHEKPWLTEDEAKKVLIERAFWRFIDDVNKIELDFPDTYRINDEPPKNWGGQFNNWWLQNHNNPQVFLDKFNATIIRCGVDLDTTKIQE